MNQPDTNQPVEKYLHNQMPNSSSSNVTNKRLTGYTQIANLFTSSDLNHLITSWDDAAQKLKLGLQPFPALPSLQVMQTANLLLNHMPIFSEKFTSESEYLKQLRIWFMSIPQLGLGHVVRAIQQWVLPALRSEHAEDGHGQALGANDVELMTRYLESVSTRIEPAKAMAIYALNWKKGGITAHPLCAFLTSTMAAQANDQASCGVLLLRDLLYPLVVTKNEFWTINERQTSVVPNATRLAVSLVDSNFYPNEIMLLYQSVREQGGWQYIADTNWEQWLEKTRKNRSMVRLFQPNGEGSDFCSFYSYLQSVMKVLSASTISRRKRNKKTQVVLEPDLNSDLDPEGHPDPDDCIDLDTGLQHYLPGADEPIGDFDFDENIETFIRNDSEPLSIEDPDIGDQSSSYTGIRVKPKKRAVTLRELQFQAIGAIEQLQYRERTNRSHLNNVNVASDYVIEVIWREIFKSPAGQFGNIGADPSDKFAWLIILNLFFSMNETQLKSILLLQPSEVKAFKEQFSTRKSGVDFPPPLLEILKDENERSMRLHLPVFKPNHQSGKSPATWLTYLVTPPHGIGALKHEANRYVFTEVIPAIKQVFDVLNSKYLLDLRLSKLAKRMPTWISTFSTYGGTAAKYLLGATTKGGDSAMIYTSYDITELSKLYDAALKKLFEQLSGVDFCGLEINLLLGRDEKSAPSSFVGSSRVPLESQVHALTLHTRQRLAAEINRAGPYLTADLMQAWQDYLLVWFLLITGERANDNALPSAYFVNDVEGFVFSCSKTDERFSASTLIAVTQTWLGEFKRFQHQSRVLRILHLKTTSDQALNLIDGRRPSSSRDRFEFRQKLFEIAPIWIDWPQLFKSGEIGSIGVAKRMRALWTASNGKPAALGVWRGNELRHFFATKARGKHISSDLVSGRMGHWMNGQSPHRVTSSFVLSDREISEIRKFQSELEFRFGYTVADGQVDRSSSESDSAASSRLVDKTI